MKNYILEELYIKEDGKYWKRVIESNDIKKLKKMKKLIEEKTRFNNLRIVEVKLK